MVTRHGKDVPCGKIVEIAGIASRRTASHEHLPSPFAEDFAGLHSLRIPSPLDVLEQHHLKAPWGHIAVAPIGRRVDQLECVVVAETGSWRPPARRSGPPLRTKGKRDKRRLTPAWLHAQRPACLPPARPRPVRGATVQKTMADSHPHTACVRSEYRTTKVHRPQAKRCGQNQRPAPSAQYSRHLPQSNPAARRACRCDQTPSVPSVTKRRPSGTKARMFWARPPRSRWQR